ncbi:hypothetical protein MTO96_034396 [Rhipicephalus appendiculatus]
MPDTRRRCLLELHRASHRGWTHLRAPVCAMQGCAPHEAKGVQGTPQETENPTAENKRADGRRSTRQRRTRPGPETLVQQGRQFIIQVQIGIKTEAKDEIGVQDQPGSRNQKEAAEEAHNQEGRRRYGEQESALFLCLFHCSKEHEHTDNNGRKH